MKQLSEARKIMDESMEGEYSGKIEESAANESKSENRKRKGEKQGLDYVKELNKHTASTLRHDSTLTYSSEQLRLLRKRQALHGAVKGLSNAGKNSIDSMYVNGEDIPDFKNEVTVSRSSFYSDRNKFNVTAQSGKRTRRSP